MRRTLPLLIAVALVVAACSGSGEPTAASTTVAETTTTTEAPSLPDLTWAPALRPDAQTTSAINDVLSVHAVPILWPTELPGDGNEASGTGRLRILRLAPEPVMTLDLEHAGATIRIESLADSESTPCVVRIESAQWQQTTIHSVAGCVRNVSGEPVTFEWPESQRFYRVTIEPGTMFDSPDSDATITALARWIDDWTTARNLPQPATSDLSFGAITGTVSDASTGAAIASVCVALFTDATTSPMQVRTTATGAYRLDPVWAGTYRVLATDCSKFTYLDTWWGGTSFASATAVTVGSGDIINIEFEMMSPEPPSATIVGTVRDEKRALIEGICVEAYAGEPSAGPAYSARTGPRGSYTLGVDPGTYRLLFVDCGPFVYDSLWYPGVATAADATTITVKEGNRIVADASLTGPVTTGGLIVGTITADGSRSPVANICIEGHSAADGAVTTVRSRADGSYELGPLPSGDYLVKFVDCGPFAYTGEWFDDVADQSAARTLRVTSSSRTTADASLAPLQGVAEAYIIGRITNTSGTPVGFICVQAHPVADPDGAPSFTERSDTSGMYALGVDAGEYIIRFIDCGPFQYEQAELDDPVQLNPGDELSGVDVVLQLLDS